MQNTSVYNNSRSRSRGHKKKINNCNALGFFSEITLGGRRAVPICMHNIWHLLTHTYIDTYMYACIDVLSVCLTVY